MKLITPDDLYNWMDIYGECPVVDGPVFLTKQEINEFVESLDKSIIPETDFYNLSIFENAYTKKQTEYLITEFANFLNANGVENEYLINEDFDDIYDDDDDMGGNFDDDDMGIYDDTDEDYER